MRITTITEANKSSTYEQRIQKGEIDGKCMHDIPFTSLNGADQISHLVFDTYVIDPVSAN